MNYEIFGGFEIPRKPNKKSVVRDPIGIEGRKINYKV